MRVERFACGIHTEAGQGGMPALARPVADGESDGAGPFGVGVGRSWDRAEAGTGDGGG